MTGYHALTWGFIMGELVRRATGRTLAEVLRTQIAGPLRMAAPAFSGTDQVMGFPARWALGYSPARLGSTQSRPGSTFGMVGANGTAAYADDRLRRGDSRDAQPYPWRLLHRRRDRRPGD